MKQIVEKMVSEGLISKDRADYACNIAKNGPFCKLLVDLYIKYNGLEERHLSYIFHYTYQMLKTYKPNVFPIKGYDLIDSSWINDDLVFYRRRIIYFYYGLPSILRRNMQDFVRKERSSEEFVEIYSLISKINTYKIITVNRTYELLPSKFRSKLFSSTIKDFSDLQLYLESIHDGKVFQGSHREYFDLIKDSLTNKTKILFDDDSYFSYFTSSHNDMVALNFDQRLCFNDLTQEGKDWWEIYKFNNGIAVLYDKKNGFRYYLCKKEANSEELIFHEEFGTDEIDYLDDLKYRIFDCLNLNICLPSDKN